MLLSHIRYQLNMINNKFVSTLMDDSPRLTFFNLIWVTVYTHPLNINAETQEPSLVEVVSYCKVLLVLIIKSKNYSVRNEDKNIFEEYQSDVLMQVHDLFLNYIPDAKWNEVISSFCEEHDNFIVYLELCLQLIKLLNFSLINNKKNDRVQNSETTIAMLFEMKTRIVNFIDEVMNAETPPLSQEETTSPTSQTYSLACPISERWFVL